MSQYIGNWFCFVIRQKRIKSEVWCIEAGGITEQIMTAAELVLKLFSICYNMLERFETLMAL